ncbi:MULTISPECIES: LysR family transcriptional regulator [unclassified Pseudonocardia]|uniref:LysR family transcriptional regulator n=1 Tax=unclassified Pseudonocardia TaxID=2619320 RepID=UPI000760F3B0|nr:MULTISPECIES: LysR substrate-binding domain-containing protein [unclassified Pseudonocardia]
MDVDVAVLRSFVVLAEEKHFARAAARLHIEQPALSQRIKRLERRTGVQLFVRDTRNVRLSAAGEEFAVEVADVLRRLDSAVARARETADGARGALEIAYTLSVGYEAVPVLLGHVEEALPHLAFEAVEAWERDVLDGLRRRRWDIGLVRFDPADDELVSILLRRERLVVAVEETHELATRGLVHLADLRDERFVMTPTSLAPGYQALIDAVLADAGVVPQTVRNTAPGNRMMALRRQKNAIALLPASARLAHPPGVGFVPVADEAAVLPVRLVHRADASAGVHLLADTVQREARRLGWLR